MALIVTTSFFYGLNAIPQLTETLIQTNVTALITELEPEFLEQLLGYPLYKQYKAWDGAAAGRFKDLRDGVEYTNCFGELAKWKGLKRDGENISPIANYIYYWWLRKESTVTTAGGEKKTDKKSSVNTDSTNKQNKAWNTMVKWNKEFWEYMYVKQDVYPEYVTNGFMTTRTDNLFTLIGGL